MKEGGLYRQILAWTLLLILSITIVPFQLWHAHEEAVAEKPCHLQNKTLEEDACHISIYHLNKGQQPVCGHQIHLHTPDKHCWLCEFATVSFSYHLPEFHSLAGVFYSAAYWAGRVKDDVLPAHLLVIFNKGPPASFSFFV